MGTLFGTDGIRGVAGRYPMTTEMARKVGRVLAERLRSANPRPRVVIGRDTRPSGPMLESALAAGLLAGGADGLLAGIIPTPAVALLVKDLQADAGVVISASHNPYTDNGIKIFSREGCKLTEAEEAELETWILDSSLSLPDRPPSRRGEAKPLDDASQRYVDFVAGALPPGISLRGLKLVVDCANGAACRVAPAALHRVGAEVKAIFDHPDGTDINRRCGSEHPQALVREVVRQRAHAGLAFDGDGDRLAAVDERGTVLTGDQLIAIFARQFQAEGKLKNNLVVTTVMSNLGLSIALKELGIRQAVAKVGDRYVLEEMLARGAVLGGEDSGHLIFLDRHTTGDGLISAVKLLAIMKRAGRPLSELSKVMKVFPQVLINVPVAARPDVQSVPAVARAVKEAESRLGDRGRVLVRYSGTQPLCRVMVEGRSGEEAERLCRKIARAVEDSLGPLAGTKAVPPPPRRG